MELVAKCLKEHKDLQVMFTTEDNNLNTVKLAFTF
uniref:Uncharacterized protein n=1 Tax=Rhizophora mucronata TaxID=61149 RepID=A0A2P2QEL3_RHIMU